MSFLEGLKIYAIIETGGKQYKVTPGQVIDVERLDVVEGNTVEIEKVLLISDNEKVTIGTPTVNGAKVVATSQGESKGEKVIVFRYKPKTRYSKKTGHRQTYTRLCIDKIIQPGIVQDEPVKKVRRRKKEVTESGA
jgi:large subunit ribosomal protein L21